MLVLSRDNGEHVIIKESSKPTMLMKSIDRRTDEFVAVISSESLEEINRQTNLTVLGKVSYEEMLESENPVIFKFRFKEELQ